MEKSFFMEVMDMSLSDANIWYPLFMQTMRVNQISKRQERLFFLSAIMTHSKSFTQLVDNMDYSCVELKANCTPKMTAYQCEMLGRTLKQSAKGKAIANLYYYQYNGNTLPNDGWTYRPRGVLPAIGMDTYRNIGRAFNVDLIEHPELLEAPALAMRAAGWLWRMREAGKLDSLGQISYLFNADKRIYNKNFQWIVSVESKL
ncbi:TPA: hypothetical protein JD836_14695 [Citrobacter freundii]|nr:hypothetical protein [Citrobacter freundii]HCD1268047.1 hypothetical protein [Citrobacter freundii]